jgi:hypothetical protein
MGCSIAKATYKTTPDKESPMWNVHSQVIYWWTATDVDEEHAYIIVYVGTRPVRVIGFRRAAVWFLGCTSDPEQFIAFLLLVKRGIKDD